MSSAEISGELWYLCFAFTRWLFPFYFAMILLQPSKQWWSTSVKTFYFTAPKLKRISSSNHWLYFGAITHFWPSGPEHHCIGLSNTRTFLWAHESVWEHIDMSSSFAFSLPARRLAPGVLFCHVTVSNSFIQCSCCLCDSWWPMLTAFFCTAYAVCHAGRVTDDAPERRVFSWFDLIFFTG